VRHATRRKIGHVVAVVVGQAQDRLVLAVLSASWVDGPCDTVRESDTENNVARRAIIFASVISAVSSWTLKELSGATWC
jgi:hypothetical protein